MKVTVETYDLNNWLHGTRNDRTLPVIAALERATGQRCWAVGDYVEVIEEDEYRREPTRTFRKLPHLAVVLNGRCLRGNIPPDLFSPLPYTFEVDLPYDA